MGNCDADIDSEVNRVIDQILREDRLESIGSNPCQDSCESRCEETVEKSQTKNCAVETSARFSIRILEALRAVQRQKSGCGWTSSSMKEVVQYIQSHYNYDGDLCSQVETTLNQVTRQGFVLRMGANRYWLVGPFACSVLNPPSSPRRGCDDSGAGGKSSRCRSRRRSRCNPIANSTLADRTDHAAIERLPDVERTGFQNGNNPERSFLRRADPPPYDRDHDVSILRNVQAAGPMLPIRGPDGIQNDIIDLPPLRRPGGNPDPVRVIRDRGIDEVEREIIAEDQFERHGCGRDQSSDEVVGEVDPLDPDGGMVRPGPCGQVVRRHSSEENMYRDESSMNVNRQRRRRRPCRRRRRNRSRRRSRNAICNRSRRNDSSCGSEADVSDETTDDERPGAKPWVRRCQKMFNPKHRRSSTCAYD